jgi:hypothetical protein
MSAADSSREETRKLLLEMVAEARELEEAAGGAVTDAVAGWLAPQYLLAAREKLAASTGAGRFEVLRTFVQDWATLRRGDHSAARLQLDREQLDLQRANRQAEKEQEFREWLKRPEIRQEFFPESAAGLSAETLKTLEQQLKLL